MNRRICTGALALAAFALAGCAALLGPRTIVVSQAQLQQWIDRRFPLDRRWLEIFDVHVAAPRLQLRPQANRIATDVAIEVGDRVLGRAQRGTLSLSYGVRYEPSDHSVRLVDVRVEAIAIDGLPAALQSQIERIGSLVAEQALNDRPIYRLRGEDLEAVRRRGYRPDDLRVTPAGLAITLLPIAAR